MSRFAFIKNKDANLYKLCLQVEERADDDIDVFMLKCRRALECIVTIAGCKGNNLYQKVDDINNNLKISREMKHKIFKLKDACNGNIHYENEAQCNKTDAYMVLDQLEEICHWLVEAIIDKQVQEVITDNVKILEQKQKELVEAFKNNDIEAITLISEAIKKLSQQQGETISKIKDNSDEDLKKQIAAPKKENIITVLGEFSRGKSTLINALLGVKVLPSSKYATTLFNTTITYNDKTTYHKKLKDGTISNISEEEFLNYNPNALRTGLTPVNLESLSVKVSSPFCQNNITIIDTPGANVVNLQRYKELADVSEIVMFLLDACMYLNSSERAFIQDFKRIYGMEKLFIVVNFLDMHNDDGEELNKLKVSLKNELKKIDCSTDNVFYVSSKQALVYRLNDQGCNLTKRQLLDLPANLECTGIVELENAIHKMLNGTHNI